MDAPMLPGLCYATVLAFPAALNAQAAAVPLSARQVDVSRTPFVSAAREQLIGFNRLVVSARGGVIIPQESEGKLLFFDSTGKRIAAAGRKGEGPGEFNEIGRLGWYGDTLWAADARDNRVSFFTAGGAFVRSVRPAAPIANLPAAFTSRGHRSLANYSMRAVSPGPIYIGAANAFPPGTQYYVRMKVDGSDPAIVAEIMTQAFGATVQTQSTPGSRDGRFAVAQNRFLHEPVNRVSADGMRIGTMTIQMTDDRRGRVQLRIVSPTGATVIERSYSFEGIPVTAADIDSMVSSQLRNRRNESAATLRALEAQLHAQTPKVRPPVLAMMLTRDGSTWLELQPAGGNRRWLRLDSSGLPDYTIALPMNARFEEFDGRTIWVSETDDVDLRSVYRYALRAGG